MELCYGPTDCPLCRSHNVGQRKVLCSTAMQKFAKKQELPFQWLPKFFPRPSFHGSVIVREKLIPIKRYKNKASYCSRKLADFFNIMIQYLQELETIKAALLYSKTYKFSSQQKYIWLLTTNADRDQSLRNENDESKALHSLTSHWEPSGSILYPISLVLTKNLVR